VGDFDKIEIIWSCSGANNTFVGAAAKIKNFF
jgi:hypothetical protein